MNEGNAAIGIWEYEESVRFPGETLVATFGRRPWTNCTRGRETMMPKLLYGLYDCVQSQPGDGNRIEIGWNEQPHRIARAESERMNGRNPYLRRRGDGLQRICLLVIDQ